MRLTEEFYSDAPLHPLKIQLRQRRHNRLWRGARSYMLRGNFLRYVFRNGYHERACRSVQAIIEDGRDTTLAPLPQKHPLDPWMEPGNPWDVVLVDHTRLN